MTTDAKFEHAIAQIDQANAEDTRTEEIDGRPQPRELLFARRVYQWVEKLAEDPSEILLLAARGHTLRRWKIPRDTYPMNTLGYHEWRDALAKLHAQETAEILRRVGYDDETIAKVSDLIVKKNFPSDPESRILEDADCLAFLEQKLSRYVDQWGPAKMINILRKTVAKMTPEGQQHALNLKLGPKEMELVHQAAAKHNP